MQTVLLAASELAVGHCINISDIEQPCCRLIAVITKVAGDEILCKYLSDDSQLDRFTKRGVWTSRKYATPIGHFGVDVHYEPERGEFFCDQVRESTVTYPDGKPRRWQDFTVSCGRKARPKVLKFALKAAPVVA